MSKIKTKQKTTGTQLKMPAKTKTPFDLMREIAIQIVVLNTKIKAQKAAKWLKEDMEAQTYKTARPIRPDVFGLKEVFKKGFVIGNLGQISDHITFLLQYEKAKKDAERPII